jgi:diguanylate cyclase (GGDEF)-like protein
VDGAVLLDAIDDGSGAKSVNILLVDDHPDQADVVERVLRRFQPDWEVTVATSGSACLERLAIGAFHVVILDYNLPGMDGPEVLRRIVESHPASSVIVVAGQGQGDEGIAVRAMKGGAADYLVKGEEFLTSLPTVVDKVIERDRGKRALVDAQRQLREFTRISLDLSMASDLDRAARILADGARVLTRSGVGLVVLLDPVTMLAERVATSHLTIYETLHHTSLEGRGILGAPLRSTAPVTFDRLDHQPDREAMPVHAPLIGAALVLPILEHQRVVGLVLVGNPDSESPYQSDQMEMLLNLSFHAANVVRNLRSVEEARREVVTDDLTALYNRRACDKRLAEEVDRAQRYGRPLSVLMMDVDHFKAVNDRYGHPGSDLVLKQVAQRLARQLRQVDVAARYHDPVRPNPATRGGECGRCTFMVILPETPGESAALVADRIRRAIAAETVAMPSGDEVPVTVNIGVASFPDDANTRDGLISAADRALYAAKHTGRNPAGRRGQVKPATEVPEPDSKDALFADPALRAALDLAEMVDAKSAYTRGHAVEVTRRAVRFAERLALTKAQKECLRIAGLLHNLGTAGVPDRLLSKPGPLTEEERKIIQAHPGLATLLAKEAPRFKGVAQAILYHHERWDGHGYPRGLKGEEIPRLARILGIVEAYQAMVSARPYRRRLTPDEAIEELRAGAGTQFDPFLVERFIETLAGSDSGAQASSGKAA